MKIQKITKPLLRCLQLFVEIPIATIPSAMLMNKIENDLHFLVATILLSMAIFNTLETIIERIKNKLGGAKRGEPVR